MKKKKYEKPEVKGEKLFQAGAATCCKVTIFTCTVALRGSRGKGQRTSTTS
jgi:hypothetical protein